MGVAVGRAITKDGLQILNYNPVAATLKHGERVRKFCMQRGIPIPGYTKIPHVAKCLLLSQNWLSNTHCLKFRKCMSANYLNCQTHAATLL